MKSTALSKPGQSAAASDGDALIKSFGLFCEITGDGQPPQSCRASPTKRARRTKAEIDYLRGQLYRILDTGNPMTVRQVFYQMVTIGAIQKTEAQYNNVVVRLLGLMRRQNEIPFHWIADETRWMRKPKSYSSAESALQRTAQVYRQAIWEDQKAYVEIWLEKEALAGVVVDETTWWDVPLMVTRGYPSLSYLYSAAETIAAQEKPCFLYYFGDRDPSGVDITRRVEKDLRTFAPDAQLHFERVAVTPAQVERWRLPTRPTKQTDSRAKNFDGESVELDAIPPDRLRKLVADCIRKHIDPDILEQTRKIEAAERETLTRLIENFGEVRE